jgi:lipoprotein-releasing system permease protein
MKNNSITYLAKKYLSGRKTRGISRNHYLSLAGIGLGVLALICVSSVMNGFRADIRSRIVGTYSEIRLSGKDGKTVPEYDKLVEKLEQQGFNAAPVVRNELLIKRGYVVMPTLCFGIDLAKQKKVSATLNQPTKNNNEIVHGLVAGSLNPADFEAGGIALGAGLAAQLGVYLGDEIQLISPMFNIPTAFGMIPQVRFLKVQAIFAAGMPEYDQSYSYIPLGEAQFFATYADEVDYLDIKTPSFERSRRYQNTLQQQYPQYQLEDWSSFDSSLYGAIRFEKFIMFIIMLFMFIIASFNLTGNLLKTISQKKRELGLLKALGLSDRNLQTMFMLQSLMLCTIGIILGLGLGTLLLLLQQHYGIIKLGMGNSDAITLPVKLALQDYLIVIFVSYLITVLSVLVPLKRIRKINAVELIRRTA